MQPPPVALWTSILSILTHTMSTYTSVWLDLAILLVFMSHWLELHMHRNSLFWLDDTALVSPLLTHLFLLLKVTEHYNGSTLVLWYHPPKVIHSGLQWTLCDNVCPPMLVALRWRKMNQSEEEEEWREEKGWRGGGQKGIVWFQCLRLQSWRWCNLLLSLQLALAWLE